MRKIPVAEPVLAGNEKKYVMDCLDATWISGSGKYVEAFEERFAEFCRVPHAIAVFNGTAALHVALLAMGVQPGDEVIVPALTYVACANTVRYCGATPVFADVDPSTWTLDPSTVESRMTLRTKAIMAVHLYGHPADMDALKVMAARHGLALVEDAAEAHGARYKGQLVGGLGEIAAFSFYGNKIITTGEGGMVTTMDAEAARQARLLKGQGMDPNRRYWFPIIGYNYRMTNIQAAIGLAQLERVDWFIERRLEVAHAYARWLEGADVVLPPQAQWAQNVYWLYSVCLPADVDRSLVVEELATKGIETRPFFHPLHLLPPYADGAKGDPIPVAEDLAARGLNLPSSASLTDDDVRYVSEALHASIDLARQKKVRPRGG